MPARDPSGRLDYLFVLTYGRSGSTLLQGILNSIPGYVIRGENAGYLKGLYAAHKRATDRKDSMPGTERGPRSSWFGIDGYDVALAEERFRELVRDALLRPASDTRVTGFKEIRYNDANVKELVGFMTRVFPGARFVVNTRNLDEVAKSKWWAKDPQAHQNLLRAEKRLLEIAEDLGPRAYRVHYDDYVTDPRKLRGLFDWLGEEFDEVTVRSVMSEKHSY
ncbi:MAG: sulfotransferase [Nocardioides sp.]|nr:sulfotransferase [Nocardioides sp.]